MFTSMFTNVMTESDARARWALAYIEFGLSEVLAVITAYRLPNHNAIGYLAYGLPLFVLVPIVSAQRALTAFKRNRQVRTTWCSFSIFLCNCGW